MTTGSGVESVAFHLEEEWARLGVETARFTLKDTGGTWLPVPGPGIRGKLALAARVVWFSTIGTVIARRALAKRSPDTVTICHNDVMAGDIYVNHGILLESMRSRGHVVPRMLRNPLHLFIWVRDAVRFAGSAHRIVVNLTSEEAAALRRSYPRIRPRLVVIGNGVDVDRYRPDQGERERARGLLGVGADDVVACFVGHEYSRKGLPLVLEAMRRMPDRLHLVVVGGDAGMVDAGRAKAEFHGLTHRVHYVGRVADPRPYLNGSDFFVFPSAYESYGLVILEALACGLPVVATPTGCVPAVVDHGINGFVVRSDAAAVGDGMLRMLDADRVVMARAARRTAEQHAWSEVAKQYVALFEEVVEERMR